MLKSLQSTWAAAAVGAITFLGTMVLLWHQASTALPPRPVNQDPEVDRGFILAANPEIDLLIADLRQRTLELDAREQGLRELETRIQTQAAEITPITQEVARVMQVIDTLFVRIAESESGSLRKDAKRFSAMSPANAAAILRHLDDPDIVKILANMNDKDTAAVLEAMMASDGSDPGRVAKISELLRRTLHDHASPRPPGP